VTLDSHADEQGGASLREFNSLAASGHAGRHLVLAMGAGLAVATAANVNQCAL
jgi:hypothetical protein